MFNAQEGVQATFPILKQKMVAAWALRGGSMAGYHVLHQLAYCLGCMMSACHQLHLMAVRSGVATPFLRRLVPCAPLWLSSTSKL